MKYIIIGLGNFGTSLAITLTDMGHEVIGVDKEMTLAESIKDQITHSICMDTTNQQAIKTLPLKDADTVIVGIGENEGASIMTTALLKKMGVERLICRAVSPIHQTVLETMNVQEIVHPEKEMAERLAMKMEFEHVVEAFSLTDKYKIAEVDIPKECVGKTIGAVNFPEEHNLSVLTIIRKKQRRNLLGVIKPIQEVTGVIKRDMQLEEGDLLVIFGAREDIKKFVEK